MWSFQNCVCLWFQVHKYSYFIGGELYLCYQGPCQGEEVTLMPVLLGGALVVRRILDYMRPAVFVSCFLLNFRAFKPLHYVVCYGGLVTYDYIVASKPPPIPLPCAFNSTLLLHPSSALQRSFSFLHTQPFVLRFYPHFTTSANCLILCAHCCKVYVHRAPHSTPHSYPTLVLHTSPLPHTQELVVPVAL